MMGQRHMGNSMSHLRRDHNNRERFESPFNTHGRGIDTYFEDLGLDSRARHLIDSRVYRNFDPRTPIESRLLLDTRKVGRLSSRLGTMERYNPRYRPVIATPGKDALPFGRAMRKLFDQLIHAEQFYNTFQTDYDNDIASIKKYATANVLNELWMLRVNGKKDPKTVLEGEDKEDDEALRESKGQFDDMKRDIAQVLDVALESTMKEGVKESCRTSAHVDTVKRMQGKIHTASEQIMELLSMVRKGRESCVALLSELELLRQLIDPDVGKNKALYKSSDDGSGEEDGREEWED